MCNGNYYAAMNLRTIRENIYAYASYADCDCYDKVEEVQGKIDELIELIENE